MSDMDRKKTTLVDRLDALNEYEREPVKEDKLHGAKTFIAMFSSEHVAGTRVLSSDPCWFCMECRLPMRYTAYC